jgi:hypothetical protein
MKGDAAMHNTTVKKAVLFLCLFIVVSLACDVSVTLPPPSSTMIPANETPIQVPASLLPATLAPNATATALQTIFEGMEVSVEPLRMVLPPGLASGARGLQFPRREGADVAPPDLTPGHVQLQLEGYLLQDKFHKPQIYVYPAQAYAEMAPAAFESIHRLDNILYPPDGPDLNNPLPGVPFFNAQQVFATNVQVISFQNGQGVRFLTEYAQYTAPANNHDLFYHFQGVTRDGQYYVIAILPVTAPMLAETSDAGAPLPDGGVPYPYMADPNADMQNYYKSVTDLLNATPSELFTPTLDQLDKLIQSMRIAQ